jgi:hypothetical protein
MSLNASLCLSLLLSAGPRFSSPTPSEQTAVSEWLNQFSAPAEAAQVHAAFENWQLWKNTTHAEREFNLALELKAISPSRTQETISLRAWDTLKVLSRENLARMRSRIEMQIPLMKDLTASELEEIQTLSGVLRFHYIRRYAAQRETGIQPPLVSARELKKVSAAKRAGFYSSLVDTSASVAFKILAAGRGSAPALFDAQIPYDSILLQDKFARDEGFVLPDFSNANSLIQFFAHWEPELIRQLWQQNRFSLPKAVDSPEKFVTFLDPQRIRTIFPESSAHDRLELLRENLHRYFLTPEDSENLLRGAFERWLSRIAIEDPQEFKRIQYEFKLNGGAQSVYARGFLTDLALNDLTLRIPKAVAPQSYQILRMEDLAYRTFPEYRLKRPPPWNTRRLDHDSKP